MVAVTPPTTDAGDQLSRAVRAKCQLAFSLGWHLGEMELSPKRAGPSTGLLFTTDDALAGLHRDALMECLKTLAMSKARALEVPEFPITDPLSHEDVIKALLPFDHRYAEAYLVGKNLFGVAAAGPQQLRAINDETLKALTSRISGLKSCFQPYSADAVVATLIDWRAGVKAGQPDTAIESSFRQQAAVWRALLSGDKLATDYVQVPDYIGAARQVTVSLAPTVRDIMRTPLGPVLLGLLVAALGLFVGGLITHTMTSVLAGLATAVGWLGISAATVLAAIRKVLAMAEESLWHAELGAAVALAVTNAPTEAKDAAVRELSGRPQRHGIRGQPRTRLTGIGRVVK